jgi:hypothetical protein
VFELAFGIELADIELIVGNGFVVEDLEKVLLTFGESDYKSVRTSWLRMSNNCQFCPSDFLQHLQIWKNYVAE